MSYRHFDAINCRPDGGFCVASSTLTGSTWDGALWYFNDWEQYQQVANIDMYRTTTMDGISDIQWYADDCILVASDSGFIDVWSLVGPSNDLEQASTLYPNHDEPVLCLAVTVDGEKGKNVISGGGDGRVAIIELSSSKTINSLRGHVGWVTSVDTHPSLSRSFVSVGTDYTMKFYDMRDPCIVTDVITPSSRRTEGNFQSVSWSNGTCIATGSETGFVSVYDLRKLSQPLMAVHPHSDCIHRVLSSPFNEGLVASASDDGTVQLLDIKSQQVKVCELSHGDYVRGLTWETNNTLISCGWDRNIYRHDVSEKDISFKSASSNSVEVIMEEKEEIGKENCKCATQDYLNYTKMETEQVLGKKNGIIHERSTTRDMLLSTKS